MSNRVEFPKAEKDAIFERASKATGFPCCEKCGAMCKAGGYDIDHKDPDAMFKNRADKKKNATREKGWLLCKPCHSGKTKDDVKNISWAVRQEEKDRFLNRPKTGFQTNRAGPFKKLMNGQVVPR